MQSKQLAGLATVACVGVLAFSNQPIAAEPSSADGFEIGGFAGAHIFNDDNELGVDDQTESNSPENSIAVGIRLGYAFHPLLTAEGELAVMPTSTRVGDVPVSVFGWRAHALIHFTDTKFRPFATAGLGFLTSSPRDQGTIRTDTDFVVHVGVGAKYQLGDNWGVRGDVRLLLPPSTDSEFVTADWEFLFGLYKTFGSTSEPAVAAATGDSDNDGIADAADQCPNQAEDADAFQDHDGCPDDDNDGDGIPDAADACPNQAEDMNGVDDTDGCPENDLDGDGVTGTADRCPSDAEDQDGFQDEDGCPDTDNDADGIPDAKDKCPAEAETVNLYQDTDGCPDTVPTLVQKFTGTIKGIKFQINSAVILASSNAILDEAAKVLLSNPSVKLEVQGHTDSIGNREHNLSLSQRRAESVVKYFVAKGVNAGRLIAKGYGPDKAVGDNKTAPGRAQNRRVDFVLIGN